MFFDFCCHSATNTNQSPINRDFWGGGKMVAGGIKYIIAKEQTVLPAIAKCTESAYSREGIRCILGENTLYSGREYTVFRQRI